MSPGACDLPVSSWLVLGPFPLGTGALRLDRWDIGDPALVSPAAGDVPPEARELRWRRVSSDPLGRVDLYSVLPEASLDNRAAYAITYVTSPEARTVRVAVESDDAVVVWINGHRVLRNDAKRELRSSADTITIPLVAGVNRLLYRVVNAGGGLLVDDSALTPEWVQGNILPVLADPHRLYEMSRAAAEFGRRDADDLLVGMVYEAIASRHQA